MSASSIRDMSDQLGIRQPNTPDETDAVRSLAAQHAHDDADRDLLLDAIFGGAA